MQVNQPNFTREFRGQIIVIGFGSIGKAVLPLITRHLSLPANRITIIDKSSIDKTIAERYKVNFVELTITKENFEAELNKLLTNEAERSLIINIANEVDSADLIRFSAHNNAHYIDTVVEPWPGFYFNDKASKEDQTNYALRQTLQEMKPQFVGTPTAISCCGANPGMISWLLKQALLNLASDLNLDIEPPNSQADWGRLMLKLNIKGIHIAERDSQQSLTKHKENWFINTWSVEGCAAECLQPAELGWGTHEQNLPHDGHQHNSGNKAAIYLDAPGGTVKVQSWTPTFGADFGYLITHNEAISIADYFSVYAENELIYRPTCHYAYHPTDEAKASIEELFSTRNGILQNQHKILSEADIVSGQDELGVLLYGNERGAYWYGSQLTIEETKKLAPHQNATGLQVASGILAGIYYLLDHPNEGIVETEELDHEYCLSVQRPYLGKVAGYYTNWKPQTATPESWQFNDMRLT